MAHTSARHTNPSPSGAMTMRRAVRGQPSSPRCEKRQAQRFTPLGLVNVSLGLRGKPGEGDESHWIPSDLIDISTGGACVLFDFSDSDLRLHGDHKEHADMLTMEPGTELKVNLKTVSTHGDTGTDQAMSLTKNALVRWCQCHSIGLCTLGLCFTDALQQLPTMPVT